MAEVAAPATAVEHSEPADEVSSIEIRDRAIDVEEIMARIRRSIEEKKSSRAYHHDALLSQGIDVLQLSRSSKNLADHLALLKYAARIDLEGEQITSHRPVLGFAIKWAKRLTRFWIRKYTDSIFTKQNHFNAELIAVLSELNHRVEEMKKENERLRKQIETLSRK